jgi:hypothetical protein
MLHDNVVHSWEVPTKDCTSLSELYKKCSKAINVQNPLDSVL